MLDLPSDGKAWKQKKLPLAGFEDAVGSIEASVSCLSRMSSGKGSEKLISQIRYGRLRITSEHVNVKWNPEENSFSLSGTYGI